MTIARQSSKAVVSAAVTFFFIISSVRLNACMARLWFRVWKRLLLQILIEPFDGELDRLLARRAGGTGQEAKRVVKYIFIFLRAGYYTHKRFVLGGEECAPPFTSRSVVAH